MSCDKWGLPRVASWRLFQQRRGQDASAKAVGWRGPNRPSIKQQCYGIGWVNFFRQEVKVMVWAALLLWVVLSAPLLLGLIINIDQRIITNYSLVIQPLSVLVAAILCYGAARTFPGQHEMRKVWNLIGAGILLWGIGAVLYSLYPVFNDGQETPYPWYSDAGYMLMYLPIFVGLTLLKQYLDIKIPLWGMILATLIFVASLAIAVALNLAKLTDSNSVSDYLVSLYYVLADPLLLAAVALLASILAKRVEAYAWWMVLGGFLLFYISNVVYTYLVFEGSYVSGNPIDIGWILGFGLIGVAAIKARLLQKNDSALQQDSTG